MNTQAYDRITDRIVALLEQGTVPWHKPWKTARSWPRNLVSKKQYRGINVILLVAMSYESPFWLTFRQVSELGGRVKKGEKACPVVFWSMVDIKDKKTEEEKKIPFLRLYYVFNTSQCDGLTNIPEETEVPTSLKPAEVVAQMPNPPSIQHGKTAAFYSPHDDTVSIPHLERFDSESAYYATLFHELTHSTGHETRLKRPGVVERNKFGSEEYGKEELVAELGSAFLCGHADICDLTIVHSAEYVNSWIQKLNSDKTLLVQAAAAAQKAVDYILNQIPQEKEVQHECVLVEQ